MKPVLATAVGIPAMVIVASAAAGTPAPVVGDGAAELVALWILGSVMCALGISAMRERYGPGRSSAVGAPLGLLATAPLLSGLLGWPLLLDPAVGAMGGPGAASYARAAVVTVGAVMAVKWAIAWLSLVPRRRAELPV